MNETTSTALKRLDLAKRLFVCKISAYVEICGYQCVFWGGGGRKWGLVLTLAVDEK
jgi:hypothetical protein